MYGVEWPPFPYHFTSRWAAKGRPQQFHCRRREWLVERHPTMRRHAAKTWARCVADWGRICRRRAWRVRHTPECGVGQRASNQSKPAGGQAQCCTTSPKQNKEQAQLSRCPMRIQWRADAHESALSPCFEWALCPHHDFNELRRGAVFRPLQYAYFFFLRVCSASQQFNIQDSTSAGKCCVSRVAQCE